MEDRSVIHSTFVIERSYAAAPERVFAAFSDPAVKRRWFAESDGFEVQEYENDFRAQGREHARFRVTDGPVKGSVITNRTTYQDIVPPRRIVIAYTMSIGDKPMSASLATFEFLRTGEGTDLIFTEQGAFFENSDGPDMREKGWRELLASLARELAL